MEYNNCLLKIEVKTKGTMVLHKNIPEDYNIVEFRYATDTETNYENTKIIMEFGYQIKEGFFEKVEKYIYKYFKDFFNFKYINKAIYYDTKLNLIKLERKFRQDGWII